MEKVHVMLFLTVTISGGNWLFRWDCFFQVGLCTPLRTMRCTLCFSCLSMEHSYSLLSKHFSNTKYRRQKLNIDWVSKLSLIWQIFCFIYICKQNKILWLLVYINTFFGDFISISTFIMLLQSEKAQECFFSSRQKCLDKKLCCHTWVGAPSCYLNILDKLQKLVCM